MNPKQENDPMLIPDLKGKAPEGTFGISSIQLGSDEALSSFLSATLPVVDIDLSGSLSSSPLEAFSTMNSERASVPLPSSSAEFEKVPQPLECLQGNPVPPCLSKTFDLVEDPSLDPIISWGSTGESFVVWDPIQFARHVLPRNFKHGNFASFVRQLNTYEGIAVTQPIKGFRKVNTNTWEFFNEAFQRGKRHLLKNIQRRRTHQSQQVGSYIGSSICEGNSRLEVEIERLRKERSVLMQEVVELQQQQLTIVQRVRQMNHRLQSAEQIQKQSVSFLAKLFENPAILTQLKHEKEHRDISSPRVRRKFVKQYKRQTGISKDSLKEGEIVRHQPDWRDITKTPGLNPVSIEQSPHYFSHGLARELHEGAENLTQQFENVVHEVMPTADIMREGSSSFGLEGSLFEGKNVMSADQGVLAGNFVSSLENLTKETGFPEFSPLGTESIIKQEDIWNASFNVCGAPSSSGNETWGNPINYEVPLPGFGVTSGMSNMWDISSP